MYLFLLLTVLHKEHFPIASLAYWLDCSVGSESRVTALVGEGHASNVLAFVAMDMIGNDCQL